MSRLRSSVKVLALTAVMARASVALAGPWVDAQPGHGFAQLSYGIYTADKYFTGLHEGGGNSSPEYGPSKLRPISVTVATLDNSSGAAQSTSYRAQTANLYAETSLWYQLAFVLSMPLVQSVQQGVQLTEKDANGNYGTKTEPIGYRAQGDLTLGLKWQAPKIQALRGFAWGPQAFLINQTGDQNGRGAYPKELAALNKPLPLPTGNGTTDIEARLALGYSFYPIPVFITADVGYHHHFNDAVCSLSDGTSKSVKYSDDIPWAVSVGGTWETKKKWFHHVTLIATARGVNSTHDGDNPRPAPSLFLNPCGQANNTSMVSFGGTLMLFPIRWVGVTYTVEHTLWGINTGYGLSQFVGLATQF